MSATLQYSDVNPQASTHAYDLYLSLLQRAVEMARGLITIDAIAASPEGRFIK